MDKVKTWYMVDVITRAIVLVIYLSLAFVLITGMLMFLVLVNA